MKTLMTVNDKPMTIAILTTMNVHLVIIMKLKLGKEIAELATVTGELDADEKNKKITIRALIIFDQNLSILVKS